MAVLMVRGATLFIYFNNTIVKITNSNVPMHFYSASRNGNDLKGILVYVVTKDFDKMTDATLMIYPIFLIYFVTTSKYKVEKRSCFAAGSNGGRMVKASGLVMLL